MKLKIQNQIQSVHSLVRTVFITTSCLRVFVCVCTGASSAHEFVSEILSGPERRSMRAKLTETIQAWSSSSAPLRFVTNPQPSVTAWRQIWYFDWTRVTPFPTDEKCSKHDSDQWEDRSVRKTDRSSVELSLCVTEKDEQKLRVPSAGTEYKKYQVSVKLLVVLQHVAITLTNQAAKLFN